MQDDPIQMRPMCTRCYDEADELFPANCQEKPENMSGPIGMYHCPDCGAMLLARYPHGPLCLACLRGEKPCLNAPLEKT
jgi:hypothetical protein